MRNPGDCESELNLLFHDFQFRKIDTPKGRAPSGYSKLWFSTQGTCSDFSFLTPFQ